LSFTQLNITLGTAPISCSFLCAVSYILESNLLSVAWMTLWAQIKIGPFGNSRSQHGRPHRSL